MTSSMRIEGIATAVGSPAIMFFTSGIPQNMPLGIIGLVKATEMISATQKPISQAISSPSFIMKVLEVLKTTLPNYITPKTTLSFLALASAYAPRQMFYLAGNVANFALRNLNRLYGPDNVDRHEANLQNLQHLHQATSQRIEEYNQLLHLLAALSSFNPSLQAIEGEVSNVRKATELHLQRIHKEIQTHRKINLHEVESAILYFMAEFEHALSVHGENICAFPQVIEELKETENRLQAAENRLQNSKKEMQETVEEVEKLNRLILEAGLEQDSVLQGLFAQANQLIKKSSSSTPLISSGGSHGITVKS